MSTLCVLDIIKQTPTMVVSFLLFTCDNEVSINMVVRKYETMTREREEKEREREGRV